MFAVLSCIFLEHDLRLVLAAAVICATACGAAFGFQLRALKAGQGMRAAWAGLAGLVAGSGVWATHFMAMLAYQPSLPMGYDPWVTAASLVIAVVGMGLGFSLPVLKDSRGVTLAGGAITGVSVAAMHFTGMAAVRAPVHIDWRPGYVAAAIAIAALGGMAAFEARRRLPHRWRWTGASIGLVLAIVGLHFTAMTSVVLTPDPTLVMPHELMDRGALALATAGLASAIFAASLSLIWMERLGRGSTLSGLRDALHAVPAGLAFFDAGDRLTTWNNAYAALMSGVGRPAQAGVRRHRFVEAAAAAGWRLADGDDILARYRAGAMELRLPDGRYLFQESFRTPDGGSVTVLNDVTEAHNAARAMAEARDAAEAANRTKTEFLANISHELRTPLNGMMGVAQLLDRTRLSEHQRDLVAMMRRSGGLLDSLVTDLLDLARIDSGDVELRKTRVALADLVTSIQDLHAARAAEKGLKLSVKLGARTAAEVECDPVRLRRVLDNLVDNAVKFTDAGEVTLKVIRKGDRVRFEVRDTGPGFDAALRDTLVQRFRQADGGSTRQHGGAGLGLAVCDEFVRLMGGELDCDSRPGHGATFGFALTLPPLRSAVDALTGANEPVPPKGFRVLVVDDNLVNRQVLIHVLDAIGADHAEACDGREAVDAVTTGAFDAILMDIQMPVMDGLEATRRIRAWEAQTGRPRTPLYIVSANGLREHVEAGRLAGADGHFNKPVSVAQLVAALQGCMEERAAA